MVWKKKIRLYVNIRSGFNLDFLGLAMIFFKWLGESCISLLWLKLFAAEEEEGSNIFSSFIRVLTALPLIGHYCECCIIHQFHPRIKSGSQWSILTCVQDKHFNFLENHLEASDVPFPLSLWDSAF